MTTEIWSASGTETHTITCTKLTLFCNNSVGGVLRSSFRISRPDCFVEETRFHVDRPDDSTVDGCENDCPMQCDDMNFAEIYKSVYEPRPEDRGNMFLRNVGTFLPH